MNARIIIQKIELTIAMMFVAGVFVIALLGN